MLIKISQITCIIGGILEVSISALYFVNVIDLGPSILFGVGIVGGILGITGGIILKKDIIAKIFISIASLTSFINFNLISGILLLASVILLIVGKNRDQNQKESI